MDLMKSAETASRSSREMAWDAANSVKESGTSRGKTIA